MSLLNNNNQTSLLFKRFQNKVQAGIDTGSGETSYSSESAKALKNVYNETIFSNNVPQDISSIYTLAILDASSGILDSSWNTNPSDQTISFFDIPNTDLRFYKGVYLSPVAGTNNAWWLIEPGKNITTDNNLLRDMIPYNYNALTPSTYTPIVKYYDSGLNIWFPENQNQSKLNWLIDYESGVLELYQTDTDLNTYNIDYTSTQEKKRPRISFIKYTGTKGASGTGSGSGLINVGDISNGVVQNSLDVSAIYFDVNGFDVSLNATDKIATITNLGGGGGGGGGGTTDISSLFFNIPLAPYDGSGVLNTSIGTGTIVLEWKNPLQNQSALPFGSYLSYPNGSTDESQVQNDKLPFHRHLHIEYLNYIAGTPSGDWIDVSINNTTPNQSVIPNTITEAYFTSQLGSVVDLCSNTDVAPFNRLFTDQLEIGNGYQFRIYLDNSGTNVPVTDPVYGGDVSWNYLYIPNISGGYISLGSFGQAAPPTNLSFENLTYDSFNISLSTTGVADVCLNTPFPIADALPLTYRFGVTISGELDPSYIQMPPYPYPSTFNVDISSNFQKNNNVVFNYDSIGSGVSSSLINLDISAAPSFNYRLVNYFGVNSAFDTSFAFATGVSAEILLPNPDRGEAISNSLYREPLQSGTLNFPTPDVSLSDAYSNQDDNIITDIWFLDTSSNVDTSYNPNLKMINNAGTNGGISGGLIGMETQDVSLSWFDISVNNTGYSYSEDTSNNPTIGYLDVSSSNLDSSRFKITNQASEAGKTPDFQNKGFYTKIDVSELEIKNITLANYPDICNNSYNNYRYSLSQFYNDSSAVPITWKRSDIQTYDFNIGKKPEQDVSYNLIGYVNSEANLNNNFFGLKRPNPSQNINIDFSFNLSQLNPDWRRNPVLSKNSLVYDDPQVGSNISDNDTLWSIGGIISIDITPISNIPINYITTTNKYNRTDTNTLPQFIVKSTYKNNVLRSPGTYDISQSIAFGSGSGKPLWWDYTWGGSGSTPSALPPNFFSSTPSSAASSIVFIKAIGFNGWSNDTSYNHTISISGDQLMWANGAFQGVGTNLSGTDYPYIDFSSNFYNPNGELLDYSIFDINGLSGESFSQTYTSTPASNNFWNETQGSSSNVNRVLKYITFNIECPYRNTFENYSGTSTTYLFKLDVISSAGSIDHEPNIGSTSGGYWVFHNEKNTTGTTSGPFDGQKLWDNNIGNSSWYSGTTTEDSGYYIRNPSGTSGTKSVLQISVGLPASFTTNSNLSSIDITFRAVS